MKMRRLSENKQMQKSSPADVSLSVIQYSATDYTTPVKSLSLSSRQYRDTDISGSPDSSLGPKHVVTIHFSTWHDCISPRRQPQFTAISYCLCSRVKTYACDLAFFFFKLSSLHNYVQFRSNYITPQNCIDLQVACSRPLQGLKQF